MRYHPATPPMRPCAAGFPAGRSVLAYCLKMDSADIALREERRQATAVAGLVAEAEPIAGGVMCFGGAGSWSNYAVALGLDGPVDGVDLDRLVSFYRDRGAVPTVEVSPFADESLVRGLAVRGFALREYQRRRRAQSQSTSLTS